MSPDTTCSLKLIMFTVIISILMVVSGECPPNCHCTRYKTFCSFAKLNTLPTSLPSTTELLRIELDHIPQLNSTIIVHSDLHNLIHLELVTVNLQEIEPGAFQDMSQLEFLSINNNNIAVLETNSFMYLENLHFLNLSHNGIVYLESGTFSGFSNLRHLDFRGNYISILEANVFQGMRTTANCDIINVLNYLNNITNSTIFSSLCSFTYFNTEDFQVGFPHNYIRYRELFPTVTYKLSLSGPLYLDLAHAGIGTTILTVEPFQNLTQVIYLDISWNNIREVPRGTFQGLVSLKILKINYNNISSINNGAFHGLNSLKWLEMVECYITTIESNAFEGLSNLQVLDLNENSIHVLKHNAFSELYMLNHIIIGTCEIKKVDENAFSDMRNLKSLVNTHEISLFKNYYYVFEKSYAQCAVGYYYHEIKKIILLPKIKQEVFVNLRRLDNLQFIGHLDLPQDMQVLKSIHLYIDAGARDSQQQLSNLQQTLRYVRDLNITLVGVNSTQSLNTFSEFQISSLTLLHSDLKFLNNEGFSTLKSLILHVKNIHSIPKQTFHKMKSLIDLTIFYKTDLIFEKGYFYGLSKLMHLFIECLSRFPLRWCINRGSFLGLHNLKKLKLTDNGITCLNPGAFNGLYNIEEIYLHQNHIDKINAGVFGAECQEKFDLSCKNITLPEYCNNSNALTTLKYLDLAQNNITHIHPHAFIACNNLQTLVLSYNHFLTLDNSFLFIPALRKLKMIRCNITNIPDNTFECTAQLSQIDFRYNTGLNKLSSLFPLKHLQHIDVSYTALLCNCELYEVWLWIRQHHVHYDTVSKPNTNNSYCGDQNIDKIFVNMDCNNTRVQTSVRKNITVIRDDFEFFKLYIEPLVLIIILIFGLASNGFLLFISLRHSDMHIKQNTLVIHLAIVDVLSLILNLPLSYWQTVNIIWEFDNTLCKIFILTKDMMVGVVVSSVVTLAIERFIVAKTFKKLMKVCVSEKLPTTWFLFMMWISGIVTSLPAYFSATVVNGQCLYCPPGNKDYLRNVWTFQLVMYCLAPAVVITFLNIKTSLFLRESVHRIPGEIKSNYCAQHRITVANIVVILAAVFVFSYLPNYILRVLVAWSVIDRENVFLLSFFTFCLFFCNTVFNPISLFIMSSKFKSYVLIYFPFLGNEQNP